MKKISGSALSFVPASHENPQNPGSLKKVLFRKDDFFPGRIQMINWALLPVGKQFALHYHEDMEEVFILISGKAKISVDGVEEILEKGDAVLIPAGGKHTMVNTGTKDAEYIALGISQERDGRTVLV